MTVQERLGQLFPQARQNTLRDMVRQERVRVNDQLCRRINQPIAEADRITVTDRPRVSPTKARVDPLTILFEDADLMVVHKPPGLLTSTTPREKRPTALKILTQYLAETDPRAKLGLVHRLDRDASGLLVFAKTPAAFDSLKAQFFRHAVLREYLAITHGVPTPLQGQIKSYLVEYADGSVHSTQNRSKGQLAVTDYKTLSRVKGRALVRVTLQTGRKHQIRAHLCERGVPIVGDPMYGKETPAELSGSRLMLAAVVLGFAHPRDGKPLRFERQPDHFDLQ